MTRLCEISGKSVQTGNNVSHSKRKTRRRFLPNLHTFSLRSDILDCKVNLRLSANGIRTIEHNLGLDNYLLTTPASQLTPEGLQLKKLISKKLKNLGLDNNLLNRPESQLTPGSLKLKKSKNKKLKNNG